MESYARYFLLLNAILCLPYGLLCAAYPQVLQFFTGMSYSHWSGLIEMRAMYGGSQTAVGIFALLGFFYKELERACLLFLALLYGCITSARVLGMLIDGADFLPASIETMNLYNLVLVIAAELPMAIVATWLLRRRRESL